MDRQKYTNTHSTQQYHNSDVEKKTHDIASLLVKILVEVLLTLGFIPSRVPTTTKSILGYVNISFQANISLDLQRIVSESSTVNPAESLKLNH